MGIESSESEEETKVERTVVRGGWRLGKRKRYDDGQQKRKRMGRVFGGVGEANLIWVWDLFEANLS